MLDEMKEYVAYTLPVETFASGKPCRLKYSTLIKSDFSGLERAMTIIARHALHDGADTEETREILKAWCGFAHREDVPRARMLNGWLSRYIRHAFLGTALKECDELFGGTDSGDSVDEEFFSTVHKIHRDDPVGELVKKTASLVTNCRNPEKSHSITIKKISACAKALEELGHKARYFTKSPFQPEYSGGKKGHDLRQISYDKVIANALSQGSLKRYYLICREDPFTVDTIRKFTPRDKEKGKSISKHTEKDVILKFTAAFLLRRQGTGQEYAPINMKDVANWVSLQDPKFEDLCKYRLADTKEELFKFATVGGNVKKMTLAKRWAELFELVEEKRFSSEKYRGRIFYSDPGVGVSLPEGCGKIYVDA